MYWNVKPIVICSPSFELHCSSSESRLYIAGHLMNSP